MHIRETKLGHGGFIEIILYTMYYNYSVPPPYGRTSRVWDSLLVRKSGCAGGRGFAPRPGNSK